MNLMDTLPATEKSRATAPSPAAEGGFSRTGRSKSPARIHSRALHAASSKRVRVGARSEATVSDAAKSRATAPSPAAEGSFSRTGKSKSPARIRSRALHAASNKRVPVRARSETTVSDAAKSWATAPSPAAKGNFSRTGRSKSPVRIRSRALRAASSKRVRVGARSEATVSDAAKSRATAPSPAAEGSFSRTGQSKSPARIRSRALHAASNKRVPVRARSETTVSDAAKSWATAPSPAAEGGFSRTGRSKSPARIRSRALLVDSRWMVCL